MQATGFSSYRHWADLLGWLVLCAGLFATVVFTVEARAANTTLGCVNFDLQRAPALGEAAREAGLTSTPVSPDDREFAGRILVWQVQAGELSDVTAARAEWIGEYVRKGGNLLLTLGAKPGAGVLRLAFLSPTTAYDTSLYGGTSLTAQAGEWDPAFFGEHSIPPLSLPLCYKLQPVSAAERGMGRYERYEMTIPYVKEHQVPGTTFWTRPLLNRDWQVRAKSADVHASALLLTGRFGAGRVAVFAGPVEQAKTGQDEANFWRPVLHWLAAPMPVPTESAASGGPIIPRIDVDWEHRVLAVAVDNPTAAPLKVSVIARIATWEQAYVGDTAQDLTIPAHATATASLPLPPVDATAYQALDFEDRFNVRIGVLSASGADLLGEIRQPVDLRPPVSLTISTDDLAARPYPFPAPGPQTLFFPNRMGAPVGAYSYAPGADAHAVVQVSNGARNLAPLAVVRDETTPDNPSLVAVNDGFTESSKVPREISAYGSWRGKTGQENVLRFTFPTPVRLTGMTLYGNAGYQAGNLVHNPSAAILECEGKEVLRVNDLDARLQESGRASLPFPPATGQTFQLILPFVDNEVGPIGRRKEPWLGEVEMIGAARTPPPELRGHLTVQLHDGLTGETIPVAEADGTVGSGEIGTFAFPFRTPALDGRTARYLRLSSVFQPAAVAEAAVVRSAETPLLVIDPPHPLVSMESIRPKAAVNLNFNTTAGFRNAAAIGTGTREIKTSRATPDDRVWAYSHQLKQITAKTRMQASRLYVTADDVRHFANPWTSFSNGDFYWDVAGPPLLALASQSKDWDKDNTVVFGFSDRWDNGPSVNSLYTWPELVAFDEFLRASHLSPLQGRTRAEVIADINARYSGRFHGWQLDRYARAVNTRAELFEHAGKRLLTVGQGIPSVPQAYEETFTGRLRGMADDSTWGMGHDDPCYNTGKQMGYLMINPGWRLSTLIQWGWNSSTLGNPFWWAPVGTTEPSRRHYYDRAWRAVLEPSGSYHSIHSYGYNTNGGSSFTMSSNDWQEWWRLEERHSLLSPDAPLGAGVVLSTSRWADPDQTQFSGGGMGGDELDTYIDGLAQVIRRLHEAGLDVSFAAPASALDKWPGNTPLILLNLNECSTGEIVSLHALAGRGVRLVAFNPVGEAVRADAADLFSSPLPVAEASSVSAGKGAGLLIAKAYNLVEAAEMDASGPVLRHALRIPVEFPRGCAGYGYRMGTQRYIVLEDWREEARTLCVRYRPEQPTPALHAVNVNDHRPLAVRQDGDDWLIDVPTRPGDGNLICLEEATK